MSVTSVPRRNKAGLARDLEVLEILGSMEAGRTSGMGVTRVAELSGRDKGQVSRTLATLADSGLVERDRHSGKYRLGFQLYAMAARTQEARLVSESLPYLREVVSLTHETAHLCVLRGGNVLTLKSEMSPSAFRGVGWEGVSVAAAQTSSGRALLSDWTEAEVRNWYREHAGDSLVVQPEIALPPGIAELDREAVRGRLKTRVRNLEDLLRELELARSQGYAVVDEEFELGLVGASAPIRDASNRIVAVINVSAPKTRIGAHLHQVGEIVKRVGIAASVKLGAAV
ncbi:MAG: IclR family transcriptional regulator [Actinobacteria bacterium]|nr:IclR family transcriptional regulator [Actinomycetota bacterium]